MFKKRLRQDETILDHYRKHELVLLPSIIKNFLLLFIPWYLGYKYEVAFSSSAHTRLFIIWTVIVAAMFLHSFLIWRMNVYYVTNQRLLHTEHEKKSLFKKTVSEVALHSIQNVSFRTTGVFSAIFRYGDVIVQAEGLDLPLVLSKVPNPSDIKDFIWEIHKRNVEPQTAPTK